MTVVKIKNHKVCHKNKDTKKYAIKRKLKSENYKSCLEVTQPENKIDYLKKDIEIDSF